MPRHAQADILTIPILNDLIFTILYESTSEQRKGLSGKYLQILKSKTKTQNFAVNSSREEKEYILNHFGFRFFYVVMPEDIKGLVEFKERMKKYSSGYGIQDAIYIHTDKQFAYYLNLYAKSIHHPNWFLNFEISRVGYHIHDWGRHNLNHQQQEMREMIESENEVVKTLLSANVMLDLYPAQSGLTRPHILILLYLHVRKSKFVDRKVMWNYFKGMGPFKKYNYMRNALHELIREKYVEKSLHYDEKDDAVSQVTISALGIKAVSNYRNSVLAYNEMITG